MMINKTVMVPFDIEIKFDEHAKCFQSYSPLIHIFSAGNSPAEAEEALIEAILMWIRYRRAK